MEKDIVQAPEMEGIVLEAQGMPDEPQHDEIYVRDGRGKLVKVEVADDA